MMKQKSVGAVKMLAGVMLCCAIYAMGMSAAWAGKGWPSRKVTIVLKKVKYKQVIQLFGKMAKVKIAIRSKAKNKPLSIRLKGVAWSTAIRSIVRGAGDEITKTKTGFLVKTRTKRAGSKGKAWPKRRITLVLKRVKYDKVLQLLGRIAKRNIVVHSKGKSKFVSVSLRNVPWDAALRSIVRNAGDTVKRTKVGFVVTPRK